MMYAQIKNDLPAHFEDNWPILQQAMRQLADEFRSDNDLYIVIRHNGQIVAFAQLCYKPHLRAFELMTLASVKRGAGSLALGRAYAIAKCHGLRLIVFATNSAIGFYNRLKIWQSVTGNTYIAG